MVDFLDSDRLVGTGLFVMGGSLIWFIFQIVSFIGGGSLAGANISVFFMMIGLLMVFGGAFTDM